jgi:hypothetical protein
MYTFILKRIDKSADTKDRVTNQPNATYWDPTSTAISDRLLQQIRDFLDREADMVVGGNDPAQPSEPNDAARLVLELDAATDGQFR